ncbi:MAG: polysaccharide biosynthesis tyrosine autokinase [Planctomycetales bacterium]|nr:polysaccharide biosynthesis tyrosine autokinase [Planctomycetales bacterium]
MAQVMENPVGVNNPGRLVEPMGTLDGQQGFDIVKVLWRWKWLPILGSVLGAVLGYLYFARQPEEFQAQALVQVVNTSPPAPRTGYSDPDERLRINRADESIIIRSQKVLTKASENGNLTEQPILREAYADLFGLEDNSFTFTHDDVAKLLQQSKDLIIEPADKDDQTTLITLSFVSTDADLAARVVNSIVDGYSEYLSEEYKSFGAEAVEVIQKAKFDLDKRFTELSLKQVAFQKEAGGVLFNGNQLADSYYEDWLKFKAQLNQLLQEREVLVAKLNSVEEAKVAERPVEYILMNLVSPEDVALMQRMFGVDTSFLPPIDDERKSSAADVLERGDLPLLRVKESQLSESLGSGHPRVVELRSQINAMLQEIAKLREIEKIEKLEADERRAQNIEQRRSEMLGERIPLDTQVELLVQTMQGELAVKQKQIDSLSKLADESFKSSKELDKVKSDSQILQTELESIRALVDAYTSKMAEIDTMPSFGQRTLKELDLPTVGAFYGPKLPPYLLGGAAVGFLLLSGLAVLMDLADRSYRSPDEIANDLGMPVLGHIPIMDVQKVKKVLDSADTSLATIHHSRGRVSEAYRAVRTGLFFSNRGSELKVIQVTSPVPGDGKSTLSANLAVTMAQSGRRVLLIDADFRRPRIAKLFGIDGEVGMAQVVAGKAELDEATYSSQVANLSIMPGGKRPSNPAELLSSNRFAELVDILREKYDMIVIDTPPLLAVSDPGAVSAVSDGVVLTMRLRRNVKPLATRAKRILESVDARMLGIVINGVSAEAGYGYSYGYNDYRYAYRYGGNYRYGYRYGYKYGSYASGYVEDKQEDLSQNAPDSQS